jgi:hypothetical protein
MLTAACPCLRYSVCLLILRPAAHQLFLLCCPGPDNATHEWLFSSDTSAATFLHGNGSVEEKTCHVSFKCSTCMMWGATGTQPGTYSCTMALCRDS